MVAGCPLRFGSTAKVLTKCMLKYYRISEWGVHAVRSGSCALIMVACPLAQPPAALMDVQFHACTAPEDGS